MDRPGVGGVQRGDAAFWADPQAGGLANPDVAPTASVTKVLAQDGFKRLLAFTAEAAVELRAAFATDNENDAPWRGARGRWFRHRRNMGFMARIDNPPGVGDAGPRNTQPKPQRRKHNDRLGGR